MESVHSMNPAHASKNLGVWGGDVRSCRGVNLRDHSHTCKKWGKAERQHKLLLELLLSMLNTYQIKHVANSCFCLVHYYHFYIIFDTIY